MLLRTKFFVSTVLALATAQAAFACVTPLPWRILSPADSPKELFTADIGASGEATSNVGYTLKVMEGTVTLQSVGGTATNCSWGATIPEPSGGWSYAQYKDVDLELWSGGNMYDTVVIAVK